MRAPGITAADEEVAEMLRHTKKPVVLAVNKADNKHAAMDAVEFYRFGLGEPIDHLLHSGHWHRRPAGCDCRSVATAEDEEYEDEEEEDIPRIAIVGRPNVGKSSLLNAILGVQRAIVSDVPGTTRDAIDTEIEFEDTKLVLIDTAGIRRRGRCRPRRREV